MKNLIAKNTMYLHKDQLNNFNISEFKFKHFGIEIYLKNPITKETGYEIDFISIFSDIELTNKEKIQVLKLIPDFDCIIAF